MRDTVPKLPFPITPTTSYISVVDGGAAAVEGAASIAAFKINLPE
jgi:hypothetical protein